MSDVHAWYVELNLSNLTSIQIDSCLNQNFLYKVIHSQSKYVV